MRTKSHSKTKPFSANSHKRRRPSGIRAVVCPDDARTSPFLKLGQQESKHLRSGRSTIKSQAFTSRTIDTQKEQSFYVRNNRHTVRVNSLRSGTNTVKSKHFSLGAITHTVSGVVLEPSLRRLAGDVDNGPARPPLHHTARAHLPHHQHRPDVHRHGPRHTKFSRITHTRNSRGRFVHKCEDQDFRVGLRRPPNRLNACMQA